jgi:hypothetical protein
MIIRTTAYLKHTIMENKIEDYIIIESTSPSNLRESVLRYIKIGYVSLGGVSTSVSDYFNYCQAMVKYSK